jgi:hypothetical protein
MVGNGGKTKYIILLLKASLLRICLRSFQLKFSLLRLIMQRRDKMRIIKIYEITGLIQIMKISAKHARSRCRTL